MQVSAAGKHAGQHCPPPDQPPCSTHPSTCSSCQPCLRPSDLPQHKRPNITHFQHYLPWFLDTAPSARCAKGGLGVYSEYIQRNASTGEIAGLAEGRLTGAFRSFSAPLAQQRDFIRALQESQLIVDRAKHKMRAIHDGAHGHGLLP